MLKDRLDPAALEIFTKAVLYQLLSGTALFAYPAVVRSPAWPGLTLALGTALFCGGLYSRSVLGPGGLAAAAPAGGMMMILSWAVIMCLAFRKQEGV